MIQPSKTVITNDSLNFFFFAVVAISYIVCSAFFLVWIWYTPFDMWLQDQSVSF